MDRIHFCSAGTRLIGAWLLGACASAAIAAPATADQATPSLDIQPLSTDPAGDVADASDGRMRAFRANLVALFDQGKYSDLDAIAEQAREQRLRFKGGAWRLHVFYGTVSYPGSLTATDAAWQAHFAKLQQWIAARPESPTPRVALAHGYLRFAWKARGNGFSDTVTPEGWRLFRQRVLSARTTLEEAAKLSTRCPEWYREMQTVALAQQWDRKEFDPLADEALANEPGYFYVALAEANYLLPKWYGQPGDTEQYAAQVADKVGGDEGAAVYFQIAAAVNCCKRTQAPAMSWPKIQQGFAALERLYGATNHERNVMAYLALRAGDAAAAQQLFARIGNDWDESVWKSKARYDASRTGQALSSTEPVSADTTDRSNGS
jgi:hypothetical protein